MGEGWGCKVGAVGWQSRECVGGEGTGLAVKGVFGDEGSGLAAKGVSWRQGFR